MAHCCCRSFEAMGTSLGTLFCGGVLLRDVAFEGLGPPHLCTQLYQFFPLHNFPLPYERMLTLVLLQLHKADTNIDRASGTINKMIRQCVYFPFPTVLPPSYRLFHSYFIFRHNSFILPLFRPIFPLLLTILLQGNLIIFLAFFVCGFLSYPYHYCRSIPVLPVRPSADFGCPYSFLVTGLAQFTIVFISCIPAPHSIIFP
jgi:hypothetical protein